MWLLVLLLQALVWCDYTFNTSTDHLSVASRYTISGQIDPATLPDDYKRGWNGWLQGVKLLITEGRWSIVGLDWRVYDLISKEVWSEIIAQSQGYQSNFRMTTSKLYILMTTESGEDIKTTSAEWYSPMISFYDDMKWGYCRLDNIHRSKAAVIRWCHNSWCCRDLIIMMKWGCDRNAKLKTAIMAKVLKTSSDTSPEVVLWR